MAEEQVIARGNPTRGNQGPVTADAAVFAPRLQLNAPSPTVTGETVSGMLTSPVL